MPTDSKTWLRGVEVRKATLVKQGERPRASQVFGGRGVYHIGACMFRNIRL
jgi:hypothetical protein